MSIPNHKRTAAGAQVILLLMMVAVVLPLALMSGVTDRGAAEAATEVTPEAASAETTAESVDCAPASLAALHAESQARLDDFAAAIEADANSALGTLYEVGTAYREIALACGFLPADFGQLTVGTDVPRILAALENLNPDPMRGQSLYNGVEPSAGGVLGCSGCHQNAEVAPLTEGTWTRWDEQRRPLAQFADYRFEQYMIESIVLPQAYIAPGYEPNMPPIYSDQLSYQDLADIIAYLAGQDQLLE
jgi:mono/diheme cytochrome c family protein